MGVKLGMNPRAARTARDSMQAQIAHLQRITTEAGAHDAASGNDPLFGESNSVMSALGTASDYWGYATNPATLLGLPFSAYRATSFIDAIPRDGATADAGAMT